jgi:hypothetical protein
VNEAVRVRPLVAENQHQYGTHTFKKFFAVTVRYVRRKFYRPARLLHEHEPIRTTGLPDVFRVFVPGFVEYTILKNKMVKPGQFEYALRENRDDGDLVMAQLEGGQGKTNPLHAARNVLMKVAGGKVVAINLEGDCVVKK